tara:strand:- start:1822 stop:2616 length:795 start_codon:yes stop_codon:yes gene_type:complete
MKKYFVIGNPINHSFSPRLHNFWINEHKIEAIYGKIKLEEDEIGKFIQSSKKEKISGLNVTVPFKKKIIPYLDKLSPEATQTQSVNTIIFNNDTLIGYNTDIGGFISAIKNLKFDMKNKKAFIIGAGGVVPSIIYALNKMEVSDIMVTNRTRQKAENLKSVFKNLKILDWGEIPDFDIIINATSIGLKNDIINLDFKNVGQNKLFYDIIYNPSETNFLKKARKQGNQAENGRLMFVHQALEAFKLWHGIEPKVNNKTIKILEDD